MKSNGRTEDLQAAERGSVAAGQVSNGLEDDLWLVPIEDRRERGASREGMRSGFTLGQYLMLVEYTGRMLRERKAAISSEVENIFARIGCTPETWGSPDGEVGRRPAAWSVSGSESRSVAAVGSCVECTSFGQCRLNGRGHRAIRCIHVTLGKCDPRQTKS